MIFAEGCCFYKLVWLFMLSSILGDVAETLFCRIRSGRWMSRSSVVWGPFSIVWGGCITLATALLYKYSYFQESTLFLIGALYGGLFEYCCSVLSEKVFGKVFWDYSEIPFNINGRINLFYCGFWGIACIFWFKEIYPFFSNLIEQIPVRTGTVVTWAMVIFMVCNMMVSFMALLRSKEREMHIPVTKKWQAVMDRYFNDEKLGRIYPNAINVSKEKGEKNGKYKMQHRFKRA